LIYGISGREEENLKGNILRRFLILFMAVLLLGGINSASLAGDIDSGMQECLINAMQKADDASTIGALKAACKAELAESETAAEQETSLAEVEETALEKRIEDEGSATRNLWTITPHRPNYILLGNYNFSSMNEKPWEDYTGEDVDLNETEVKFQISFKFMLWENLFKKRTNGDLFFAYTQLAMWQLYNKDISSPFRDTNYEPEFFLSFDNDWKIFGFTNRINAFGFAHQSNGRSGPVSRSWNRVYASFIFEKGNFASGLKVWYRLPEDEEDDNNPDIEDYLGNFELRAAYKWDRNTFGIMWRNNLDFDENRGAVQLDWSFPLPGTDRIKGYVQYFNGYGQCLIDYNASASTLGAGLLLTDWL
jgi:phospholipase A1